MDRESINFVVGQERRLGEVVKEADVAPLLRCALGAGLVRAAVLDAEGEILWQCGAAESGTTTLRQSVLLEGEPVGALEVEASEGAISAAKGGAKVLAGALQAMIDANLKRMLTTEIHTHVVNRSYEELLETNRQLAESEARYRELAQSLEIKVQERTEELKRVYAHLIEQEKMASVGQLAAGVAHEINNPLGFILSNLHTLQRYVGRYGEMLDFYRQNSLEPALRDPAAALWSRLKIDFIREDVDELLSQSIEGAERMKKIVADLKGFSHIDDIGCTEVDLHCELDRTLDVMRREIPEGSRIVKEYGDMPPFVGYPGKLCQAFLNIFRNAFQCGANPLEIVIRTEADGDRLRIVIADNGPGIPQEIRTRIFEPFFTTRDVGEGMGLGLTVAYNNVAACGGTLRLLEGAPGTGAAFTIDLPCKESAHGPVR